MDCLPARDAEPDPALEAFASARFAPRPPVPAMPRSQRLGTAIAVLALHVLFVWVVEQHSQGREGPEAKADDPIVVDFLIEMPPQVIRPAPAEAPGPSTARPLASRPRPATARPIAGTRRDAPADAEAPLQLYLPDGSVRLPDGLMDALERNATDRQFDFQYPGLADAGRLLDRPPVLVYEPTRFDEYWEPDEDLLSEILRKAVEKTSKEIRIPIPGAPGRKLVCRVSLLAAGGACGVERNGGNDVVSLDDPTTLDAEEAAACQSWWDRIVDARTQDQWRATRRLYEDECRKPLEKLPPAPREAAPVLTQ